jgi:hypothetical protein
VVQIHPDPPFTALLELFSSLTCNRTHRIQNNPTRTRNWYSPNLNIPKELFGAIAQLGERLPCTQEVSGSIPLSSTTLSIFIKWFLFKSTLETKFIFK